MIIFIFKNPFPEGFLTLLCDASVQILNGLTLAYSKNLNEVKAGIVCTGQRSEHTPLETIWPKFD